MPNLRSFCSEKKKQQQQKNTLQHSVILYYKCHKINFKPGGSYKDYTDWTKANIQQYIPSIRKINAFNATVALNHGEIKKRSAKNNKIKPK